MRICGDGSISDKSKGKRAIRSAIEVGYSHFDHADIYGAGQSESLFGEILKESSSLRDEMFITSKAGIRPKQGNDTYAPTRYDFSKKYILESVEGSLKRLGIEQLDMFMLHRPDYLMNVDEVADVFDVLKTSGKVKHFGVSNFKPSQVNLLSSILPMPLIANQVEINIHNIDTLSDGTLDQCQQHGITPIAWCPLGGVAYPAWGNTFLEDDEIRIATELAQQASL